MPKVVYEEVFDLEAERQAVLKFSNPKIIWDQSSCASCEREMVLILKQMSGGERGIAVHRPVSFNNNQ